MAEQYDVQIVTDATVGTPGAVRVGPYYFGTYKMYWSEVESLPRHRERLAEWRAERADSKPSQAGHWQTVVADHEQFIAMLEATAPVAAAKFDQLAGLGVTIPYFGAPAGGYGAQAGHVAARAAGKDT